MEFLHHELEDLRTRGLLRSVRAMPATGGVFQADGQRWLNFSSNDYLNLANDPRVKAAAHAALDRWGAGATASRLMTGHLQLHQDFEERLARFLGTESVLLFGSGFLCNLGVLTALAGPGDVIYADKLNHASLIDGMRLSGAKWVRYRHNDVEHLRELLGKATGTGRRLVVTDSVFSMDGDIASLEDVARAAREFNAMLVVDEAHAIGVQGPDGRGCCAALEGELRPDVIVGTLSKSLASYGGFAASSEDLRKLFVNRSRSFVYSTGLPPPSVGAALGALAVIESDPTMGMELQTRAKHLADQLSSAGVPCLYGESQILAVMVGDNHEAVKLSIALEESHLIATAIRPPTVPAGTSRLRLSVTLAHDTSLLDEATALICKEWRERDFA